MFCCTFLKDEWLGSDQIGLLVLPTGFLHLKDRRPSHWINESFTFCI